LQAACINYIEVDVIDVIAMLLHVVGYNCRSNC